MQFALALIITRGLPTGDAGTLLEAIALFTILASLVTFGSDTGIVRTIPRLRAGGHLRDVRGTLNGALLSTLVLSTGAAIVTFLAAGDLARLFFGRSYRAEAAVYVHTLAIFLPAAAVVALLLAASRGFGAMKPWTIGQLAVASLRVVFVGAAVVAGADAFDIGLGWGVPSVIVAFSLWLVVVRQRRKLERLRDLGAPRRFMSWAEMIDFWRFSSARGAAAVAGSILTWLDVLLVGHYRSAREAAIYAAASRLAVLGTLALQAVGTATAPMFARLLARDEIARVAVVYHSAATYVTALTWPFYICLIAFAPVVMGVFGPGFSSGATSVCVLSVGMMFNVLTGNITGVLLMSGRSVAAFANTAAALAVNIVMNVVLIPRYGMSGAALAWTVSIVFNNLLAIVEVYFDTSIRPLTRAHAIVGGAAVACFGAVGLVAAQLVGRAGWGWGRRWPWRRRSTARSFGTPGIQCGRMACVRSNSGPRADGARLSDTRRSHLHGAVVTSMAPPCEHHRHFLWRHQQCPRPASFAISWRSRSWGGYGGGAALPTAASTP